MKRLPVLLLGLALAGFAFGLLHLFNLRFEAGDNYPPYSSLRADPLGSKALYESLDQLLPARRHLQSLSKLTDTQDATLFWLGEDMRQLRINRDEIAHLQTFLLNGGRIVFALLPALEQPRINRFAPPPGPRKGRTSGKGGKPPGTNAPATPPPTLQPGDEFEDERFALKDHWDFNFDYAGLSRDEDKKILPATALRQSNSEYEPTQLPARINLHTGLYFDKLGTNWIVHYARVEGTNRHPVVIERLMGAGSVVLMADSYYFSNESLRNDREPELLTWLVGPAREVIFDETHLGVQSEPGVATLARKYRLGGLFFALLVLAGLFIWRNSVSFMPPYEEELARERGDSVEGKDSASGFINLLRRNIAPGDLMKVCLEQWNAHFTHARKPSAARLEAMQRVIDAENQLDPRHRNPIATYRKFVEILSKRT